MTPCPCGSGQSYAQCCGRFIGGGELPATAEQLMRSRYTAYVRQDADYVAATWHASTRPPELGLNESPAPKWIGLAVLAHSQTDDDHAVVEFVARYKLNGRAFKLHETSRFVREHGHWYYLDGHIDA